MLFLHELLQIIDRILYFYCQHIQSSIFWCIRSVLPKLFWGGLLSSFLPSCIPSALSHPAHSNALCYFFFSLIILLDHSTITWEGGGEEVGCCVTSFGNHCIRCVYIFMVMILSVTTWVLSCSLLPLASCALHSPDSSFHFFSCFIFSFCDVTSTMQSSFDKGLIVQTCHRNLENTAEFISGILDSG